jgi:large subunit ribosomal protein L3
MLNTIFATKIGMSQAWSKLGKRLPITKLMVDDNCVLSVKKDQNQVLKAEIAYGAKKLKNVAKPLREQISQSGFSSGFRQIRAIEADEDIKKGEKIQANQVLEVGDVVAVQGVSKGRGFAGVVKRYGFHGGPRTHGQSDRQRAPGSIGSGTDPGRVWKGKKMPGHYGVETKTVLGLVVAHIDLENKEVWVTGPVPGHKNSIVRIQKTGEKKDLELNMSLFKKTDEQEVKKEDKKEELEKQVENKVSEKKVEEKAEKKVIETNKEVKEEKLA